MAMNNWLRLKTLAPSLRSGMYTVSQFSRLTGINVRSLYRLHDKLRANNNLSDCGITASSDVHWDIRLFTVCNDKQLSLPFIKEDWRND